MVTANVLVTERFSGGDIYIFQYLLMEMYTEYLLKDVVIDYVKFSSTVQ